MNSPVFGDRYWVRNHFVYCTLNLLSDILFWCLNSGIFLIYPLYCAFNNFTMGWEESCPLHVHRVLLSVYYRVVSEQQSNFGHSFSLQSQLPVAVAGCTKLKSKVRVLIRSHSLLHSFGGNKHVHKECFIFYKNRCGFLLWFDLANFLWKSVEIQFLCKIFFSFLLTQ